MKQKCKFDPDRDLVKHRPGLHIDISQVLESNTLPAGGAFDVQFDDVDDVDTIGPRVESVFDAVDYGIQLTENIERRNYHSGTGNNIIAQQSTSDGGAE